MDFFAEKSKKDMIIRGLRIKKCGQSEGLKGFL